MSNIYNMTDTWTEVGTTYDAIKMDVTDTASVATSKLLDLKIGGASKFSVRKDGYTVTLFGIGTPGFFTTAGAPVATIGAVGADASALNVNNALGIGGANLAILKADAIHRLALRNGTNAQGFRIYNTYTSLTNYERLSFFWSGNVATISNEAQTGTLQPLNVKFTPQTVASLPVAATVGAGSRMFVSDALAPTFGATVAGGGAINVPVYSDGANWKVG